METLDKIICINLKERTDKYNVVKKVFEKINLNVDFFFAEKHKTSGRIGCFESHIEVIQQCYNNNFKNVLIFEDDVVDTPDYDEKILQNVLLFLKNNNWCEYFQLGYTILPHEMVSYFSSNNLYRQNIIQYNGNCTHAYILTRPGMERILHTWKTCCYEKELDLDIYYKEIFAKHGASVCPILFDQNFCLDNNNEKPTTAYYSIMRSISCFQYKYSFLYVLSYIRCYIKYIVFLFLLFFCTCIVRQFPRFFEKAKLLATKTFQKNLVKIV
jgi:GR25 family glycosyltransferase involved in LPS biosynthesis